MTLWTASPRWKNTQARSAAYLRLVASKPCLACRRPPPSEPHHLRFLGGGGVALKPSDFSAIPLCGECHRAEHQAPYLMGRLLEVLRVVVEMFSEFNQKKER